MSQLSETVFLSEKDTCRYGVHSDFAFASSFKSKYLHQFGEKSKLVLIMQNRDLIFKNVHYYRRDNPTFVSLSRAALAELMPPPYLSKKKQQINHKQRELKN